MRWGCDVGSLPDASRLITLPFLSTDCPDPEKAENLPPIPGNSREFTYLPSSRHCPRQSCAHHCLARVAAPAPYPSLSLSALPCLSNGVVGIVVCPLSPQIFLKPTDLLRLLVSASSGQSRPDMDTVMEPAAPGALHDDLAELLTAAGAEDTICGAPEFMMGGKKSDEAAPADAGDEDGGDDDGDDDGDFAEGEEEISEGEEYDNAKGNDNKKKQRGDEEENGEEDEEEPEEQEGGGGDDDDDDDDDNEDEDDDEDAGEDDEDGVEEEDDDQDNEDEEEDDDEDSLQPPKKRKK